MTIHESTFPIMRKDNIQVKDHSKAIFIELKKKKTEPIFNAIKMWYRTYKPVKSEETGKVIKLPIVDIFDSKTLQRSKLSEDSKAVYGDAYAKQLMSIFKILSPDFSKELFQLIKDLDVMKRINSKDRLVPLLNDDELIIVHDALKLYRRDNYKVKVKTITPRTNVKREYIVNYKGKAISVKKEIMDALVKEKKLYIERKPSLTNLMNGLSL